MEKLKDLNYGYTDLEPIIDKETMQTHHSKHHLAYVTNFNNAVKGTKHENMSVQEVLKDIENVDENIKGAIINNGGGVVNHNIYFTQLINGGKKINDNSFLEEINQTFGSLENLISELKLAGMKRFGSGWSWLVIDGSQLKVLSTPNQNSPIMDGQVPLLGIDVWEHAYYLKYQNRRAEYLDNIFSIIDWEVVTHRYLNK